MDLVKEQEFEDELVEIGGSEYLHVSKAIKEYLGAKIKPAKVRIRTEHGKHGPYISVWIK